jgi:hypothetical protein
MNGDSYEMIVWWSDDDCAFVVEVPELPGCVNVACLTRFDDALSS